MRKNSQLCVAGTFSIYAGCKITILEGATIQLGGGYINSNCRITCKEFISIGTGVAIADDVVIIDSDFHNISEHQISTAPVIIGNNVWIGVGAKILKGVTIGDGAVIGAGSVVSRDVMAGMLAVGSPAREIRPIKWS